MNKWLTNRYNGLVFGRTRLGDIFNAIYTTRLFLKYSFSQNHLSKKDNLKSFLIKQYHIIEKGMALPNPRENFGIAKINVLLAKADRFEEKYGFDDEISTPIRNCLTEYLENNKTLESVNKNLHTKIKSFIEKYSSTNTFGGTKNLDINKLRELASIDFKSFVETRTSIRDFKEELVNVEDIKQAIEIARNTPSVCNRQNWKLHYYDNKDLKNELLGLQHGNNGFTDSIQGLFIVTSDMYGFTRLEQNQVFVDGGLISMNLVLALHNVGIGSCCLNTCFPYTRENKIKQVGNIPKNERLIMMIGVGYWKDNFKVAYSKKKGVNEILRLH